MACHTTPADVSAMIKLPHGNASPGNDLADALAILRVALDVMGDGRAMSPDFVSDVYATICAAKEKVDGVFSFLNTLDLIDEYRAHRIAVLLAKGSS